MDCPLEDETSPNPARDGPNIQKSLNLESSMDLIPRGLLESPRMMIRATERGEPSKKKQMKPQSIQGLQKKIAKDITSMKFSSKLIGTLGHTTNLANASHNAQVLERHFDPPDDPITLLQTNPRQDREIRGMVEAMEPQNYNETVKAIFDEARKAGDAREAERTMELSQPEANHNQTTHQPVDILPGVAEFFEKVQKKTGGAKVTRGSSKIKTQKATKPKTPRIEPIEDICLPCLNGNSGDQDEEWGLAREELCRISRDMYKNLPKFKKNLFSIPANKQGKRFLQKYTQTLQWADEEDGNQHFAWACNIILPVICLQVSDPKRKMRHHAKTLEDFFQF